MLFGAIPKRYENIENQLEQYFAMGRGLQKPDQGIDVPAMEMKKWFDTNCTLLPSYYNIALLHDKLLR